MRRIETYELIERYLLGRASPGENAEIELRMKNDPSFANEVGQHRDMQQVIHDHSILGVKDILTRIRKQKQISIQRRNKFYRSMLIVGSCAIIVSLSLLLILNNDDGAVRRASEAPGASEAFTDKSAPANESGTMVAENEPSQESIQKDEEEETVKTVSLQDDKAKPEKDDADRDIPADRETGSIPQAETFSEAEPSAAKSPQDAFIASPDLQSVLPPCEIKAEYSKEPSCNNKATGVIRIAESTLAGGTPPYQAILNGEHGDSLVFRGLKPGFYKLEIKDASDCLVSLGNIIVETKECRYEGNFYPLLEVWDMPLDSRPGTIELVNKNGVTVYRLKFDGAGREYWNGNDMNNEALPMGIYFFTIRYDSGDVFQGSVTINR